MNSENLPARELRGRHRRRWSMGVRAALTRIALAVAAVSLLSAASAIAQTLTNVAASGGLVLGANVFTARSIVSFQNLLVHIR